MFSAVLKLIRWSTGSQCRSVSRGLAWEYFGVRVPVHDQQNDRCVVVQYLRIISDVAYVIVNGPAHTSDIFTH